MFGCTYSSSVWLTNVRCNWVMEGRCRNCYVLFGYWQCKARQCKARQGKAGVHCHVLWRGEWLTHPSPLHSTWQGNLPDAAQHIVVITERHLKTCEAGTPKLTSCQWDNITVRGWSFWAGGVVLSCIVEGRGSAEMWFMLESLNLPPSPFHSMWQDCLCAYHLVDWRLEKKATII